MAERFVDPILEEIWKIRDEHAALFNYDVDAIFADMKREQDESGIPVVSFEPQRISRAGIPAEDSTARGTGVRETPGCNRGRRKADKLNPAVGQAT